MLSGWHPSPQHASIYESKLITDIAIATVIRKLAIQMLSTAPPHSPSIHLHVCFSNPGYFTSNCAGNGCCSYVLLIMTWHWQVSLVVPRYITWMTVLKGQPDPHFSAIGLGVVSFVAADVRAQSAWAHPLPASRIVQSINKQARSTFGRSFRDCGWIHQLSMKCNNWSIDVVESLG